MFKFLRRGVHSATVEHGPPPAMTPIEVGLSLRAAREREGLSLEDIRARTDVPVVDLDALEQGRLDVFHIEQAAIVGLWRYSEALGLLPEPLVEVIHRAWPTPALGVDYFSFSKAINSTPLAQLALAGSMLGPIVSPRKLSTGNIGLSKSMLGVLSTASSGASRGSAAIGPARPPRSNKSASTGANKAVSAKSLAKKASSLAQEASPRSATALPAKRASSAGPKAPSLTRAPRAQLQFPQPAVAATPAPEPEPVEEEVVTVQELDVQDDQIEVEGHWVSRLSKVFAERFGVEDVRRRS